MRRYNWKKILTRSLWLLAGIGTIVLLGAAMQKKAGKPCADIKIEINGATKHMFIDEKDVRDIINSIGTVTGNAISVIDLRAMESIVEKNPWVSNAEMFIDNNQVLQVRIDERQPVARVFTLEGESFYVDSGARRLPLSDKLSARIPVFTGFPSDKPKLAKPDSVLLQNVVKIGKYILADSFWMAQVAQIDITPQSNFEMVPVIGDQTVTLGNAEDIDKKFDRLYTFYQKAWLQNGINTYERLDVQYDKQVVAVRKGATKAWVDSARAREAVKNLLANAQAGLADSASAAVKPTPVFLKPVKDSVKTKTPVVTNNITIKKPLSKGKKLPGKKAKAAKAVMEKKQTT